MRVSASFESARRWVADRSRALTAAVACVTGSLGSGRSSARLSRARLSKADDGPRIPHPSPPDVPTSRSTLPHPTFTDRAGRRLRPRGRARRSRPGHRKPSLPTTGPGAARNPCRRSRRPATARARRPARVTASRDSRSWRARVAAKATACPRQRAARAPQVAADGDQRHIDQPGGNGRAALGAGQNIARHGAWADVGDVDRRARPPREHKRSLSPRPGAVRALVATVDAFTKLVPRESIIAR